MSPSWFPSFFINNCCLPVDAEGRSEDRQAVAGAGHTVRVCWVLGLQWAAFGSGCTQQMAWIYPENTKFIKIIFALYE